MVCLPGLDGKSYARRIVVGGELPEIPCPDPYCSGECLRGHGFYERYLGGLRVALRRLRCPRCGVTHALLPEDVCAYRDLSLEALERALGSPGPSLAARRAGESADDAGIRRARRWLRQAQGTWTYHLQALLPPVAGPWWERAGAILGTAPGMLVRLRHWLGSTWRCFLGGLTGLYRCGRPRYALRGDST
jgi:hypothetical protein